MNSTNSALLLRLHCNWLLYKRSYIVHFPATAATGDIYDNGSNWFDQISE
ncbi:MAG: hypothetical protein JO297_02180 [Nitrososphaeraceae archaeon]|nr:hypothetical protein [Nitrososphaeraceae archaeon]